MKQTKQILEASFPATMYEVERLVAEGWKLSQTHIPAMWGYVYEVHMEKGEDVFVEEPVAVSADAQEEINDALDKADEEDAAKHPPAEDKPAAPKRGPKPKAK